MITLSETERIVEQVKRAFDGPAWHGPPILSLVKDVGAEEAYSKPIQGRHSIWEIVLHNLVWNNMVCESAEGKPMRDIPIEEDWLKIVKHDEGNWKVTITDFDVSKVKLIKAISSFPNGRLNEIVSGRTYSFYTLFHGLIQHNIYHAGQIAVMKKK